MNRALPWLMVLSAVACAKAKPEPVATGAPPPLPASEPAALVAQLVLDLDGVRVQVSLPIGWHKDDHNTDERMGLAVFRFDPTALRSDSVALNATREVVMLPSLDIAAEHALALPECDEPNACSELSRAMLPGGGMQVSVRRPYAVSVSAWLPGPNGRALHCNTEASDRAAWIESRRITDPVMLEAMRTEHEAACRSIQFLP